MRAAARWLAALAWSLLPVALVLSHRNLVVVLTLLAVAGVLSAGPRALLARPSAWSWPLLALAAYLAVSSLWTPAVGDRDWAYRVPLFVLTVMGALLAARMPGGTRGFGLSVLVACVLLGFEGLTGGLIRDLVPPPNAPDRDDVSTARGVGLAVVLLPACALCLRRAFGRAGLAMASIAAACLLAGAARFDIAANPIALMAMLGAATATVPRRTRGAASGALVMVAAGFVVFPIFAALLPEARVLEALTEGPVSWRQRLVIWRTVADATLAGPMVFAFGAGQQASAALGEAAGTAVLAGAPIPLPRVPTHPHNVFLQVWYEAGALGCALAAGGLILAARRLAASAVPADAALAIAATAGAAFVFLAVDASLWTLWRGAALALAACAISRCARASPRSRRRGVVHRAFTA